MTISNTDNIINSREIISRIRELEDQLVDRWVAGWNMPGYMPNSDPAEFEDFDDAKEYIAEELEREADMFYERYLHLEDEAEDDEYADQEEIQSARDQEMALRDDREKVLKLEEGDFGATLGRYHYWIKQDGQMGLDEDEMEELEKLKAVQEEAEGYCGDWEYGATLIHEDYFETYAQELAEDIGAVGKDADNWIAIDWEKSADNLKMDYTSVDFDGETYWVRM